MKCDFKSTNLVSCNTPPRLLCSPEVADSVDLQNKGESMSLHLIAKGNQKQIHKTDPTLHQLTNTFNSSKKNKTKKHCHQC